MFEDLKTKYPYITEEQWAKVELAEADYTDFLSQEDLKAQEEEYLARQEAQKEQLVQGIISQLKATETTPQAQLIIGGTFVLQAYFLEKTGRYIGQDVMHQFIQYPEFRGLRIYVNSYTDADGVSNPGFNIRLSYTHESGMQFEKTVPGMGNKPSAQDWTIMEVE